MVTLVITATWAGRQLMSFAERMLQVVGTLR
jgi:type III secretory pathway component EscS